MWFIFYHMVKVSYEAERDSSDKIDIMMGCELICGFGLLMEIKLLQVNELAAGSSDNNQQIIAINRIFFVDRIEY